MLTITARRARFLGGQHTRHRLRNRPRRSSSEWYPHRLDKDSRALPCRTGRRVPKHYEPELKKTITELPERQVIAPVDEPTTWRSPAFFVPMVDSKRVRLVTDFMALNIFVLRLTHTFPSTREIIEAIPPDAKLFCKLNAVHGYFQLALDERPSKLKTFLIQQGCFRYLRVPMGINAPSEEWCRQSDSIIRGLPYPSPTLPLPA